MQINSVINLKISSKIYRESKLKNIFIVNTKYNFYFSVSSTDLVVGKQSVKNKSPKKCIKEQAVEHTITTPRINYSDSAVNNSDIVEMTLTTHDQTKSSNVRKCLEQGECIDLEELVISINSDDKILTERIENSDIPQESVFRDIQDINKNTHSDEWIKNFDHLGSTFYVNPRTGN